MFVLVDCSILPPCPYHSTASCIAVNVPSECPRLCGLCDRYEVLKRVYGENNLAPNTPLVKPIVTTPSTKKKPIGRKLKKKLLNRYVDKKSFCSSNLLFYVVLEFFRKQFSILQ
jgi:hypothetical protein